MAQRVGAFGGTTTNPQGQIVKLIPEWRVYVIGAVLCAALTACSRYLSDRGGPYFMACLAVAGISYLLAIREFFAAPKFSARFVVIGLILAAVWHIAFLRVPSGEDDDIHRYVWDGHLQRLGYNPYLVIPSDPAMKGLHTAETRSLNNPDLPSPYPPGAQLFFRAATALQETTIALKMAFVFCELLIVFLLVDVLHRNRRGAHLVLAFAWNPLMAIEVAGSGHIDIVGALLLLASVAALGRRWRGTAAVALGLAIAVKLLPIVLLPLYWKRVRIRDAALAVSVVGIMYLPFLEHGRLPTGSLGTFVNSFRFNGPVFAALHRVASPQLLVALAVLAGWGTAIWLRSVTPQWSPDVFAWPMAISLLCAPVIFPWYLLWLLPFLTSPSTLLIIFWSVSISLTYVQWHLRTLGHPWSALPVWIMLLEYGFVGLAGTLVTRHRRKLNWNLPTS
jgi:alpha-1,6-mannosyltransferase